jgi:hypothetical protein
MLPKPFLFAKQILLREYARRGERMRRSDVRHLLRIDDKRFDELYSFLFEPAPPTEPRTSVPMIKREEEADEEPAKLNGFSEGHHQADGAAGTVDRSSS